MGLDIYFSKVSSLDYSLNKETAIKNEIEIDYFRKVNFLLPHFGYEDNCEYLEIEKWQIEDLVQTAKELLTIYESFHAQLQLYEEDLQTYEDDKEKTELIQCKIDSLWKPFEEVASQKLPTTDGFYFGDTDYREEYVYDLMDVAGTFTKVLDETDFDVEQVLMYCWW